MELALCDYIHTGEYKCEHPTSLPSSLFLCPLIRFSHGQIGQLILNCLEENSKGQREQTVEKMLFSSFSSLLGKKTTILADVASSLLNAERHSLLQQ